VYNFGKVMLKTIWSILDKSKQNDAKKGKCLSTHPFFYVSMI
jgi:hypothetical protein